MMVRQDSNSPTSTQKHSGESNGEECFNGFFTVQLHTGGKRVIWALAIPVILWLAFICFYFILEYSQISLILKIFLSLLGLFFIGSAVLGIKKTFKSSGLYFKGARLVDNEVELGTVVTSSEDFKVLGEDINFNLENARWISLRSQKRELKKFSITICSTKASSQLFLKQISLTSENKHYHKVFNSSKRWWGKFCIIRKNKVYLFSPISAQKSNEILLDQLELMGIMFEAAGLTSRGNCILKIKPPWKSRQEASKAAFWGLWAVFGLGQNNIATAEQIIPKIYLVDVAFDKKFFSLIHWFGWRVEIF
jgi:hypothetical protein